MSNIILPQDDVPQPFAWLSSLRNRLLREIDNEMLHVKEMLPRSHALNLVSVAADLLPQVRGLEEIDEADMHDLAMMLSSGYRRLGNEASTIRAMMWDTIGTLTRQAERSCRVRVLYHFLAVFANVLLAMTIMGRVSHQITPIFITLASDLTGDLAMLTGDASER